MGESIGAQDPGALARFTNSFTEAIEISASGQAEDLARAHDLLARAGSVVDQLPEARRALARFFVDVRIGELHLRAGQSDDLDRSADITSMARQRAREDGVYSGPYRVLALVLLWQALPPGDFVAMLEEPLQEGSVQNERDYLLDPALETGDLANAAYLRAPVRLLRSDLLLGTTAEYRALRDLRALAEELSQATGENLRWRHMCLHRLARYYMERHSYDRALVYLEQLPDEESLYPRGLIALKRGDSLTAESIGQRLASERDDDRYYHIVGDARELEHRYDDALDAYDRAWRAARGTRDRASARNGRGDALLGLGRLEEAGDSYREALDELAQLPRSLTVAADWAESFKDMGRLDEASGERLSAYEWYRRSLEELEDARRTIPPDLFGATWLGQHGDQLTAVDGILRMAPAGADLFDVLAAMEKLKARSLLDSLALGRPASDPELRRSIQDLALSTSPEEVQQHLQALEEWRDGPAREAPRGQPLDGPALREWWQGQQGSLVLSYWLAEDRAWLLAGEGGGELELVQLGAADEARELLEGAFAALANPEGDPGPALQGAASFFLPPSLEGPLSRLERVLICPDTDLFRMPFAALPWGGGTLGITHTLVRTPSLSAANELATRKQEGVGVLLVDSVLAPDLEQDLALDPLLFSEREGDLVSLAHPEARRLRGGDATLTGLAEMLAEQSTPLVHVSAHAVNDARVPSQSLLLLADGLASMRSLATLDLGGSTVVLTACASALGSERGREGLVGLPQGVLEAGAARVVAPLWNVNQQATADLMGQFHHFLAEGLDEAQAMASARARLMEAEQYSHPHYWAGFSVFGAFEPVPPTEFPWLIFLGGSLLLILVAFLVIRTRRSL